MHLKFYFSERAYWVGCPCCGYSLVKPYELKVVDIDEEKYIGRFIRLNSLKGRRLAAVIEFAYVDWV